MYALLQNNGRTWIVWGIGATGRTALIDAKDQDGFEPSDDDVVERITDDQASRIKGGTVDATTLGIQITKGR